MSGITQIPDYRKASAALILPPNWIEIAPPQVHQRAYIRNDNLRVMVSEEKHKDGRWWLHVSCSRKKEMPSWNDLKTVKRLFIGDNKLAIQVLPPREQYINVNPNVLHLFHCLSDDVLPDFRVWIDGKCCL